MMTSRGTIVAGLLIWLLMPCAHSTGWAREHALTEKYRLISPQQGESIVLAAWDLRNTPFKFSCKNMLPNGYAGTMGTASAGCMADFVVVNMIAEAASGNMSVKEAIEKAEKRAKRYYR